MEKITLKLAEYPDHPRGYGLLCPPSEDAEWALMTQELPSTVKYLKHFRRTGWEATSGTYSPEFNPDLIIPLGLLTYYVDVYVDGKN